MGDVTNPKNIFVGYISPSQKNAQVAEVNEVYTSEEKDNTIVKCELGRYSRLLNHNGI